ncbi:uncharacterized protein LOC106640786 [Copidosoma floridanum]|uniref:uncharacterized protein LOC106640786 n=1 Tax=Copidosoma floridanum TaxID=29053 RepID=UPI0006C9A3E5|nr:uncharacterized protein LOC106640786 [Copidosoma floridanum]
MPWNSDSSENYIADAPTDDTVTPQDVALVAQRFTKDPSVRVLGYDLKAYSSDKLGFSGCHRQLTIKFKKNHAKSSETIKLFVKSVAYDNKEQSELMTDAGIFVEEHNFFNSIIPQLLENYAGEQFAPICYLSKADCLIMEDLRCHNYQLRASFFNCHPEVESALSTLARFHASTIIAEAKLTQSFKRPMTLKERYPDYFTEKIFKKDTRVHDWITSSINVVCAVGKKFGHDPDKLRKAFDRLYEIVKPSEVHRNAITHSDLWTNNIMFDDGKPTPKSVLVDFQVIRYSPLVLDVLKFLYMHTSRDFRDNHEKELVQVYHSVMEETIKNSKMSGVAVAPTLLEITYAMDDLRVYGPGMATLYLPAVLLDPEMLKEATKDSMDFFFSDRTDLTLDLLEKNKVYRDRIKEAVDELSIVCNTLQ